MPKKQAYLYDSQHLNLYETEDPSKEFLLPAARAELEQAERPVETEDTDANAEIEDTASEEEVELTPAEMDEIKYAWISDAFGRSLAADKNLAGTVIFYADDREYNVEALRKFVEEGLRRMEKANGLKKRSLKAVFGGFRESMDVEYWAVPSGAKQPTASPVERPANEPEEVNTEN